jgi:protein-S-isoprenylcysteine O-methyltransferase Ste14
MPPSGPASLARTLPTPGLGVVILVGWAVSFGVPGLWAYTIIVAVAFHLRVVLGEEPWLARTHGAEWQEYARRVPRWFL